MTTITIPQKIHNEMKTLVARAVNEILNDPDFGMKLTKRTEKRLEKEQDSKEKRISFRDIKKRYL